MCVTFTLAHSTCFECLIQWACDHLLKILTALNPEQQYHTLLPASTIGALRLFICCVQNPGEGQFKTKKCNKSHSVIYRVNDRYAVCKRYRMGVKEKECADKDHAGMKSGISQCQLP